MHATQAGASRPYNCRMPLLIDGHNLIGKMPDMKLSDPDDEDKLISRLKKYVLKTRKQVSVVFDPPKHSEWFAWADDRYDQPNLEITFATMGRSADDVIRERIVKAKDKQGLIVVTSDAAVANFARQCGVKNVRSSESFAEDLRDELKPPAPSEKPGITQADLDEWLKVFPEPKSKPPPPAPPKPDVKLSKSEKRMEQLKKQAKGRRLR
jgi:predicted RNA-binding protein with PIN domain